MNEADIKINLRKIQLFFKFIKFIIFFLFPIGLVISILIVISSIFLVLNYDEEETKITATTINIPESVLKHKETIIKYMRKYNIPDEYLPYILAQATQESGGQEPDIFQASESKYNGRMGMIKTADESIEHAMKRWREISDEIDKRKLIFSVELILQTYNYGSGYLSWVEENGRKWTEENAESFSKHKLKTLQNWNYSVYGDIKYIQHIFRYLVLERNYKNIQNISDSTIKTVISEAYSFLNVPYQLYGNNPPYCIDCSAFTLRVYKKIGINFSHSAQAQYEAVTNNGKNLKTRISDLEIGDLVFFKGTYNTSNFITHVGIYIGGGKMINAQIPRVKIADIENDFGKYFVGGGSPWHLIK